MKNEIHHIDEYFAEGLANVEFDPPVDVWKNIEKELDRKRRVRFIAVWTSMAAGLALFLSLGIYILNNHKNDTKQVAISSKSDMQNLSPAINISKIDSLSNKQVASSAHKQPIADNKKSSNASFRQQPDITNSNDNQIVAISEEDSRSYSNQVNPVVDDNDALFVDNGLNDIPDYVVIETTQPENNIQPIPLISNLRSTNTDKPSNTNIVSNIEVVNPLQEYGAINDEEKVKNKNWSLEGQVAPQYSYRNISDTKGYTASKDAYDQSEDGLIAYGGGFKVNYQSGKRLSFQVGAYYSVMGQVMNNVYEIKEPSGMETYAYDQRKAYWVDNSLGRIANTESQTLNDQNKLSSSTRYSSIYVNNSSSDLSKAASATQSNLLDEAQIIQQLKFIEIPFMARYKLINKKIGCHVIGGFSTNVLVNSNVWLKQNGSRELIGETSDLKRVNYSSVVGLGIDYQWFKNISLSLEPTYKYYLNSVTVSENMKVHPYSFGIFTGLVYKF